MTAGTVILIQNSASLGDNNVKVVMLAVIVFSVSAFVTYLFVRR